MRKSFVLFAFITLSASQAFGQANPNPTGDESVAKGRVPRFYGFSADFSAYDGTALNAANYNNSLSLYFEGGWAIGKMLFGSSAIRSLNLAGRFSLTIPFVGGNDEGSYTGTLGPPQPCTELLPGTSGTVSATPNRCQVTGKLRKYIPGDTWLTLSIPGLIKIPKVGIGITPAIRAILPSSVESQFATTYLSLTAQLGANKSFFGGKLTLAYTFGVTKWFHKYKQPLYRTNELPPTQVLANNISYTTKDTTAFADMPIDGINPNFGFRHLFLVDISPTDKLSFTILYFLLNTYRYELNSNDIAVNGQPYDVLASCRSVSNGKCSESNSDTNVFWLAVNYQILDWLGVSLSWITWAPIRKPDNSFRQGIASVDYNAFTSVNLGFAVSIDKLAGKFF